MANKSCSRSQICSAPLCPESNNIHKLKSQNQTNNILYIWYPDEEICRCRKYSNIKWIKKQKKIQKKTVYRDFYFTIDDIEKIRRVTNKTKGQNPDSDKGSDTIKTPQKFHLKPHLSGYRKTQVVQVNPKPLNPILRQDSDIEY